jgi:phosphoribosylamine--glycine ligase
LIVKVLVVGNGGREHALAWKLLQSDAVEAVFCLPGNGGTATLDGCQNLEIQMDNFADIAKAVTDRNISLVVVGPEIPLSQGITDFLQQHEIAVFGPTQVGAQIESSKAWAKVLLQEAGIPTAHYAVFTRNQHADAITYLEKVGAPIVVKADGLAAGKGVTVAQTLDEAKQALDSLCQGELGAASDAIVIEEFLVGQEVSVLALTDGITIRPLLPAQDHKTIGEGDTGPNTGGMGAYTPTPLMPEALMQRVQREILEPTVAALQQRGIDYCGVLYAGLIISPDGEPKVLEYNCRFGDPETQAVLPLLDTPLEEVLLACTQQRLGELPPLAWKPGTSMCVVIASGGYPGSYQTQKAIAGIAAAEAEGAIVFHAGTTLVDGEIFTTGGRVLGVTALGDTFPDAIQNVYRAVPHIQFEGSYYRRDIGHRCTV